MTAIGQPRRLAAGGRIDRSHPVAFSFDGAVLQGYRGDTLASALIASGIDVVGRSFKYGRPRGIVGHGAEEPNAIVTLGAGAASIPNLRATQVELYDGLEAHSTAAGVKRFAGLLAPLMPAGFYYKMFMGPQRLWMAWEQVLRRAAGLGAVPSGADPDRYDKVNQHCDVLVAGGGPAGLMAALAAGRAGARVILADEQAEFGGSLLASTSAIDGLPAAQWAAQVVAELHSLPDVTLLPRSTVFGYYDHNFLGVLERRADHLGASAPAGARQRLHRVRAAQTVLTTGAVERPLVFANNDLPGNMLASAVSTYVNRYAVVPGERLVLFTTNDAAYRTALDWRGAGRRVVAVVDCRANPAGVLVQESQQSGIEVLTGHAVVEAVGAGRVAGAMVAPVDDAGACLVGQMRRLDCDLIACSGGWSPAIHLSSQAGARPSWSDAAVAFVPGAPGQATRSAGAASGTYALPACLAEGAEAGRQAAAAALLSERSFALAVPSAAAPPEQPQQALFLAPHPKPVSRAPHQFVDLQLDVTAADIELAAREGYRAVEHVKRYTALGFGTDQGKLGNVNGVAILARSLGQSIAETGTTIFRPAYTPVSFGAIAGRDLGPLFDPERHTPMHAWHVAHGAEWENVARWKRPWYYPKTGETMHEAVQRECLAVRHGVGILDASTLGKIDIQGPHAAAFLDRIYAGGFLKLGLRRCRYGLMLREDGTIFDDGVTARVGKHRYLMHTTTGNAEAVLAWLELWRQTEWPELKVYCTSVTDHWATATLAGPKSRQVLAKVCSDIDLAGAALPFMSVRRGTVAGVPARVFRISFNGELTFEVNVAAQHGQRLWEALMEAGAEFDITPYGTETMHVLRAEKGFIIVGQDTDGSMTPDDMGLGWAVRRKKPFGFIGDRSLDLADHRRSDRLQFVGLETLDGASVLPEGAQIVVAPNQPPPVAMHGHVTSSYFSAALNRAIALAMVRGGRSRMGEVVHCPLADGRALAARIVEPVFYDPQGERQNV